MCPMYYCLLIASRPRLQSIFAERLVDAEIRKFSLASQFFATSKLRHMSQLAMSNESYNNTL